MFCVGSRSTGCHGLHVHWLDKLAYLNKRDWCFKGPSIHCFMFLSYCCYLLTCYLLNRDANYTCTPWPDNECKVFIYWYKMYFCVYSLTTTFPMYSYWHCSHVTPELCILCTLEVAFKVSFIWEHFLRGKWIVAVWLVIIRSFGMVHSFYFF